MTIPSHLLGQFDQIIWTFGQFVQRFDNLTESWSMCSVFLPALEHDGVQSFGTVLW